MTRHLIVCLHADHRSYRSLAPPLPQWGIWGEEEGSSDLQGGSTAADVKWERGRWEGRREEEGEKIEMMGKEEGNEKSRKRKKVAEDLRIALPIPQFVIR